MPKINQMIELTFTEVAFGGDGVARLDGQVVFVPFVLPGEKALVRVTETHRSYLRGTLETLVEASPLRQAAPCPYYTKCGGCQYQHLDYKDELELKQGQFLEAMRRIGGQEAPVILPIIPSPQPYGYRNKISLHLERGKHGYRGVNPADFVPVEACLLASERINQQLARHPRFPKHLKKIALQDRARGHAAFQQVNRFMEDLLRRAVAGAFADASGTLVEGYSGDGFFTLALAERFEEIHCVEWDSRAAEHAGKILPSHVAIINEACESGMAKALASVSPGRPLHCLVDPPREGLGKEVRELLKNSRVETLVYLSCNPSTLARDLKELSAAFVPLNLQPIDLFPRTAHIECLAVCRKCAS